MKNMFLFGSPSTSNPANFRQPALFSSDHPTDVLKNTLILLFFHMS
jgi:hypothetical protein